MNPQPEPLVADNAESVERLFHLLDSYWESLVRREGADAKERLNAQTERDQDLQQDLLTLDALNHARLSLDADSRLEVPDTDPDRRAVRHLRDRLLLKSGTKLGDCRIERLLGLGGMGEVYLAVHEVMNCRVAVKVLPAHLSSDPDAVSRFRKEVQTLAKLNPHPNVVAAMHASEHEGRLYLVMQYAEGVNLKEHVEQAGPLPVDQAIDLVRQAARGLEHAHKHPIVHRDIKPSNLMLAPDGTVKILDLGLARLTAPHSPGSDSSITASRTALGTADFIAPEQARDARNADSRSDLYSLGCTCYFLVTGQPPFVGGSVVEKLLAHAQQPPPPLQQLRPDVPAALAAVVGKLLAKQPEDRYQSAEELIRAPTSNCVADDPALSWGPAEIPG